MKIDNLSFILPVSNRWFFCLLLPCLTPNSWKEPLCEPMSNSILLMEYQAEDDSPTEYQDPFAVKNAARKRRPFQIH